MRAKGTPCQVGDLILGIAHGRATGRKGQMHQGERGASMCKISRSAGPQPEGHRAYTSSSRHTLLEPEHA